MAESIDLQGGEAAQIVRQVIATVLPGVRAEEITADKHLRDLGADSVDRVEIILGLIDRFGIDEPMSTFSRIPNIGALVDYLSRSRP